MKLLLPQHRVEFSIDCALEGLIKNLDKTTLELEAKFLTDADRAKAKELIASVEDITVSKELLEEEAKLCGLEGFEDVWMV